QVALQELAHPAEVPHQEGIVESQGFAARLPIGLAQVGVDHEVDGIAGRHVDDGEVDEGDPDHNREHDQDATDHVAAHEAPPQWMARPPLPEIRLPAAAWRDPAAGPTPAARSG